MTHPHRELSNPSGVSPPLGKYSHVAEVTASKLLFLAGQVSVDEVGSLVGEGDVGHSYVRPTKTSEQSSPTVTPPSGTWYPSTHTWSAGSRCSPI